MQFHNYSTAQSSAAKQCSAAQLCEYYQQQKFAHSTTDNAPWDAIVSSATPSTYFFLLIRAPSIISINSALSHCCLACLYRSFSNSPLSAAMTRMKAPFALTSL